MEQTLDECATFCDMMPTDDIQEIIGTDLWNLDHQMPLMNLDDFFKEENNLAQLLLPPVPEPVPPPNKHGHRPGKEINLVRQLLKQSPKTSCGSPKAPRCGSSYSYIEKIETTKRKLQEGYEQCKNARKRTCVINMTDVPTLPPDSACRSVIRNQKERKKGVNNGGTHTAARRQCGQNMRVLKKQCMNTYV